MPYRLGKAKAWFYHIPKTGGTWVVKCCMAAGMTMHRAKAPGFHEGHCLPQQLLPPNYRLWPGFCLVRNPTDWYQSFWRFYSLPKNKTQEGQWHVGNLCLDPSSYSLDEWVERVCEQSPGFLTRVYEWYIGPPNGSNGIKALRLEDGAQSIVTGLRHCGVDPAANFLDMPECRSVVNGTPSDITLSQNSLRLIRQTESEVMRRWRYS